MSNVQQNRISVIIPTLNEGESIEALLAYLRELEPAAERIVADGGSSDGTSAMAGGLATVVTARTGRAAQMNAGAAAAHGDILWFLHADCRPHPESFAAIRACLENPAVVGGAFEYRLDETGTIYRLSEFFSNRKNQLLHLIYGDMGIFVRHRTFDRLGGYADIPLMEDMDFARRLKREGHIRILPYPMMTSARRWREEGAVKNILRNWMLQIAWFLGASPQKLSRWYSFSSAQKTSNSEQEF